MIVGGTGHRLSKYSLPHDVPHASGYDEQNPLRLWIQACAEQHIRELRPLYVISGLAIGFDQDLAEVCVRIGQPFIAAVPFIGQEKKWPWRSQQRYRQLLKLAYEVIVTSPGGYSRDAMLIRNCFMVDHSNAMLAAFDGTTGGTAHTVHYAHRVNCDVIRINPSDFREQLQRGAHGRQVQSRA